MKKHNLTYLRKPKHVAQALPTVVGPKDRLNNLWYDMGVRRDIGQHRPIARRKQGQIQIPKERSVLADGLTATVADLIGCEDKP